MQYTKEQLINKWHGGLIVSCQALENEPLHSSEIMARMALAAYEGGAVGIRANTPQDIIAIKKQVSLPIIGLYKKEYPDSEVYITPTEAEIIELIEEAASDVIAMDATNRKRPGKMQLDELFRNIKKKYPNQMFMADCATLQDVKHAVELGFDFAGTTLCGYTKETKNIEIPNVSLIQEISKLSIPIIAEGGIWTPDQLAQVLQAGATCAVVGTAITRPQNITRKFVDALSKSKM